MILSIFCFFSSSFANTTYTFELVDSNGTTYTFNNLPLNPDDYEYCFFNPASYKNLAFSNSPCYFYDTYGDYAYKFTCGTGFDYIINLSDLGNNIYSYSNVSSVHNYTSSDFEIVPYDVSVVSTYDLKYGDEVVFQGAPQLVGQVEIPAIQQVEEIPQVMEQVLKILIPIGLIVFSIGLVIYLTRLVISRVQ